MEEEKKEEAIQEIDSENSNQQVQEDKPKGQSRDENAYYADLRRKYEEKAKKIKYETFQKATDEDILKDLGLENIDDEYSMKLVEFYKEGKKEEVDNPPAYAYKKANSWRREENEKTKNVELEEKKNRDEMDKELKEVKSKYNKSLKTIQKEEPNFEKYMGNLVDSNKHNLVAVLDAYYALKREILAEYTSKQESEKNLEKARKMGDFLKSSNGSNVSKKYSDMSSEEKISELKRQGLI